MITQIGLYCKFCKDYIFSNSRHDFESCKCGYFFIDGGFDYFRAGANSLAEVVRVKRDVDRETLPYYFKDEKKKKKFKIKSVSFVEDNVPFT